MLCISKPREKDLWTIKATVDLLRLTARPELVLLGPLMQLGFRTWWAAWSWRPLTYVCCQISLYTVHVFLNISIIFFFFWVSFWQFCKANRGVRASTKQICQCWLDYMRWLVTMSVCGWCLDLSFISLRRGAPRRVWKYVFKDLNKDRKELIFWLIIYHCMFACG